MKIPENKDKIGANTGKRAVRLQDLRYKDM